MYSRPLFPLLAATNVIVDVICWPLAVGDDFPAPGIFACFALAFSQVSMLAIWAGLATTTVWLRLPILAGGAMLAAAYLGSLTVGNYGFWINLIGVQLGVVMLPLLLLRLFRVRLQRYDVGDLPFNSRPIQFTLRRLMASITALAVVCGIARHIDLGGGLGTGEEAVIIGAGLAATALTAVWVAFGTWRAWFKIPVLAIVSITIGLLIAWCEGWDETMPIVMLVVLQTALLMGSLGVLRKGRYRLTRNV
jgi:hypothetical protein